LQSQNRTLFTKSISLSVSASHIHIGPSPTGYDRSIVYEIGIRRQKNQSTFAVVLPTSAPEERA
jgi:hypothetical protein